LSQNEKDNQKSAEVSDSKSSQAVSAKTPSSGETQARSMPWATRDGYDNFLSRIGLNNDNTLSDGTYTFNLVTRNRILLEAAYRGSWVVGAMVDSVAEDMTKNKAIPATSDKGVDLSKLKKAETRLQIWESLCTGLKWGRLYGGALGVLMIAGQDPSTPLDPETVGKGQFEGIAIYDRWMLNPILSPVIPFGPDIGLPMTYQIVSSALQSLGGPTDPDRADKDNYPKKGPNGEPWGQNWKYTGIVNVHHSRVIRFIGIELPFFQAITEMMWGESNLERLWDRLIGFDNASMSSAQLIDRANLRTVSVDGLREILAAGGEEQAGLEKMFAMMRLLQVNEGLTLIDKEDTLETTSYSFAGLSDLLLQLAQQLSGGIDVPLKRLLSQSPAGLSDPGDSDLRMYYDNVHAKQESRLRRGVSLIYKVLFRSVYGKPVPDDFDFEFTPLYELTSAEKATVANTTVDAVTKAQESGLLTQRGAVTELKNSSRLTGIFGSITEEDVEEASEEMPPMPDETERDDSAPPKKGDEEKKPTEDGWISRWLRKKKKKATK
jgi:uncharacterized protein